MRNYEELWGIIVGNCVEEFNVEFGIKSNIDLWIRL